MIGVFGANGFLGRHIVRRLIKGEVPVRAVARRFDRSFCNEFAESADLVEADLRQSLDMVSALAGVETVIQLISSSSPGLGNEHVIADIEDNIVPHVEFLQSCIHVGVKRYVFVSSGGTVYGPDAPIPTPETWPCRPISSHGVTKLAVEKYIQMYGHTEALEYFILRLSNPIGPGQRFRKGQGLIPAILSLHRKREPVLIYGDGAARRDYIYVDDVIDAIDAATQFRGRANEIINIGSGEAHSVLEVVETIEDVLGVRFKRSYRPARNSDVDINCLDICKAETIFGWRPKTPFHDAIKAMIE